MYLLLQTREHEFFSFFDHVIHVSRSLFYFTKYLPENFEITTEGDKERQSTSFEGNFYNKFYS